MEARPKIKIELTPIDSVFEFVGLLTLFFMWGLTFYNYSNLPDRIPTHFNASGQPDDYGNKSSIFILPIIGTILFIGLTVLNKFPHIFNYPVNLTASNALLQYTNGTRAIRYIKTIVVVIFSLIDFFTYLTATGRVNGLGSWFLPLILVLILVPTTYFLIKAYRVAK